MACKCFIDCVLVYIYMSVLQELYLNPRVAYAFRNNLLSSSDLLPVNTAESNSNCSILYSVVFLLGAEM